MFDLITLSELPNREAPIFLWGGVLAEQTAKEMGYYELL